MNDQLQTDNDRWLTSQSIDDQDPKEYQILKRQNNTLKLLVYILSAFILLSLGAFGMLAYREGTVIYKTGVEVTESGGSEDTVSAVIPTTQPEKQHKNLTWKTEELSIQHESARSGKKAISIEISIPESWTIQTYPKLAGADAMIKNCSDYIITSPINGFSMQLSPVCSGWAATYSLQPSDAVMVSEGTRTGNAGEYDSQRLRYGGTTNGSYVYADADSDTKIMDVIMIKYAAPYENTDDFFFIPAKLTATYLAGDKETYLEIGDQIAASIVMN